MSALRELLAELHGDSDALAELAALLGPARTLHTVATLARELEVSDRTIRRAIETGELAATRRAGRWVMTVENVTVWAREGCRPAPAPRRDRPQPRRKTMASALGAP